MIEVVFGDLLQQDVEAIVNPANSHMLHGGGLAAVIAHRAGMDVVLASQSHVAQKGVVKTGQAIMTVPGLLPFKNIIHTVGPVWESDERLPYWRRNSEDEDPDLLLERAHFSALKCAWEAGLTSVGFPAVSCGVFRFPVERAAPIAVRAVRKALSEYSPPIERVVFCLLDDHHYECFSQALQQ